MRIIGGQFRGKRLAAPGTAGGGEAHLRPTSDRVRESLFNLLVHGDYGDPPPPEGRRVLDLFAGTGALGWRHYHAARCGRSSSTTSPPPAP